MSDFTRLHEQFKDGRSIYGIKDESKLITFISSWFWIFLIPAIYIIFPLAFIARSITVLLILLAVLLIITIFVFRMSRTKIYFRDNCIIYKRELGKEEIIDITKGATIHTYIVTGYEITGYERHSLEYSMSTYAYIEQDDTKMNLSSLPTKKLMEVIDNLYIQ